LRVQVSPLCLLLRIRGGRGGSAAYPSSPRRYGPAGRCAYRATSATCRWPSVTACLSAAQVGALSCSQARIGARPLPRPHGNAVDHRTLREPERHRRDLSRAASQRDVLAPDSECGCWTRTSQQPSHGPQRDSCRSQPGSQAVVGEARRSLQRRPQGSASAGRRLGNSRRSCWSASGPGVTRSPAASAWSSSDNAGAARRSRSPSTTQRTVTAPANERHRPIGWVASVGSSVSPSA
jgi:hypothetical protein